MPGSSLSVVVQQLRAAAGRDGAGVADGELLTRFLSRRDEDALAALVQRHATMVWGVCHRILRNPHDAEDAFQATFLVLVQKAVTVVPRDMVANWLHGVAHQTAVRLRATAAKRGWREVQMDVMPEPGVPEDRDEEMLSMLDEELGRLPERHRTLLVLCDLEGRTRKEVARHLGCPEGTVASGLARARELLAKRLTRRGLAVSGGSLAAALSHSAASADVPASVVTSTINVATLLAAGKAAGMIPGPVATLTQGVVKAMLLKKILTTAMAVLALGVAVVTCGSLAVGQTEGKPAVGKDVKAPVAEKPVEPQGKQEKENKEPVIAWGKEVDGLQLGLALVPANKTAYRAGETMEFAVHVRNVTKDKLKLGDGGFESTPKITTATGEAVRFTSPPLTFTYVNPPTVTTLQPGEAVALYRRAVFLDAVGEGEAEPEDYPDKNAIRVGAGKYKIAFEERVRPRLTLSTGAVEFEVKAGGELKPAEKKEAFTAWGQEIGSLQAGLSVPGGLKKRYQMGDTITLVVRVRNVGKAAVKFEYVREFLDENRPTVTDAEGKAVPQFRAPMPGYHNLKAVTLEPGKEVVLRTRTYPASGTTHELVPVRIEKTVEPKGWPLLVGTGKVSLRYEQVLGNSSADLLTLDPVLSKLATGKLELEVEEPKKEPEDKREAFAAWGKEVGGLQAGLMCVPSDKRTFRHRETVTLVVRVRNVGKEVVKFQYLKQFLDETPLTVTDADGMPVPHPGGKAIEGEHAPVDVALKPGEEVVLESKTSGASGLPFEFVPLWSGVQTTTHRTVVAGPGKFGVQFERVLGNSSSGKMNLDPALEKLATGRLELEIGSVGLEVPAKANPVTFTVKNATIDDVDEKAGVVSVSFGTKEKPTKLVNVPLDKGVRVVASHVLPGVANNLPFEWKYVERLKGKGVSVRLAQTADGLAVVSIASGND